MANSPEPSSSTSGSSSGPSVSSSSTSIKPPSSLSSPSASLSVKEVGPNFPKGFPSQEILKFVEMVRSGDISKNRVELIKLGLWIAGCTMETFLEADNSILRARSPEYYAGQVDALAPKPTKGGQVVALSIEDVAQPKIDPSLIIAIIRLIMSLLEKRNG